MVTKKGKRALMFFVCLLSVAALMFTNTGCPETEEDIPTLLLTVLKSRGCQGCDGCASEEGEGGSSLTVNGWYYELDGEPIYLTGYSPGVTDELAVNGFSDQSRIDALPEGINYMRTWLECWNEDALMPPFELVDGKADISRISREWLDQLKEFLDQSARARVIPEITLFNPWAARALWEKHWWNPANNIQGLAVDAHSLYTLNNPCQPYQEQWVRAVLDVVDHSLARTCAIIEIDNELKTGGGAWREHFVELVASEGDYLVSTIHSYCGDYDPVAGRNQIINIHGGGSGNPEQYRETLRAFNHVKPTVFNELYVWWRHPREVQRTVLWSIFMTGGMFCVYHWGLEDSGGEVDPAHTAADVAAVGRFANSIPFYRLRPDESWFHGGAGNAYTAAYDDGAGFLAYLWGPREGGADGTVTVALPEGQYTVAWIDPCTAKTLAETPLDSAHETRLTPPTHDHDMLCLILKKGVE